MNVLLVGLEERKEARLLLLSTFVQPKKKKKRKYKDGCLRQSMWHCVSHFMACLSFWVSFTTWVLGSLGHAPMEESGKATLQNLKPHLEAQRELELESNFSCLTLLMDYLLTLMIIFASNATYTKKMIIFLTLVDVVSLY